jgi:iron complex transport system substrate-binding protein
VLAIVGPDAIVGVDRFSQQDIAAVADRPSVGDFIAPSQEAILRLRPDLVVLDRVQAKVDEGLRAAGIATLVLRMETTADVTAGLRAVGERLDRADQAAAAIARVDAEVAAVGRWAAERRALRLRASRSPQDERDGARPRVLLVVDRELGGLGNLIAAGPDNYLHELVELAGGDNVLADAPVRFARISVEEVIQKAPDVILDAVHTKDLARAAADWNVLSTVPAVRDGRVHVLGDTNYAHPGPHLGDTLRGIAERIYAE